MKSILASVKPFVLSVSLIVAVAALLLALDDSGKKAASGLPRVALVQHASQVVLDEAVAGIVRGLANQGYVDGKTVSLKFYNAQGDLPTANDIAKQVTSGSTELIITTSTVSMQSVANANRKSKVRHVFGTVTNSASAGIGVSATDSLDHPPYLTGMNSLMPVDKVIKLARELNPGLRRLGLVWHSSEANSQIYTAHARVACKELGIELLEADAENSSAVSMAAKSLVSRNVDAFIITGDVVVLVAADAVIAAARADHIPVFTIIPPTVRKGALFDLGANYNVLGYEVGLLAGRVLAGTDPATVPIINRVPEKLAFNLTALKGLRGNWRIPPELLARADVYIDESGEHVKGGALVSPAASAPAASAAASTASR
jgi:ABC-type uncharacterized transport system substrate-binding protein